MRSSLIKTSTKSLRTATQSLSSSPGLLAIVAIALKNQQSPNAPKQLIRLVKMSLDNSHHHLTLYDIIATSTVNVKLRFVEDLNNAACIRGVELAIFSSPGRRSLRELHAYKRQSHSHIRVMQTVVPLIFQVEGYIPIEWVYNVSCQVIREQNM